MHRIESSMIAWRSVACLRQEITLKRRTGPVQLLFCTASEVTVRCTSSTTYVICQLVAQLSTDSFFSACDPPPGRAWSVPVTRQSGAEAFHAWFRANHILLLTLLLLRSNRTCTWLDEDISVFLAFSVLSNVGQTRRAIQLRLTRILTCACKAMTQPLVREKWVTKLCFIHVA